MLAERLKTQEKEALVKEMEILKQRSARVELMVGGLGILYFWLFIPQRKEEKPIKKNNEEDQRKVQQGMYVHVHVQF